MAAIKHWYCYIGYQRPTKAAGTGYGHFSRGQCDRQKRNKGIGNNGQDWSCFPRITVFLTQ